MKTYKKVELVAKNAPSGSYAAGCPEHTPREGGQGVYIPGYGYDGSCKKCEVTA